MVSQRKTTNHIRTTVYQKFLGADFSTDPALVDKARSPLCTNMISDGGGMPERRCGWRVLYTFLTRINGIFSAVFDGDVYFYVHAGNAIYTWNGGSDEPVMRLWPVADEKSRAAVMAGKLWIVTGSVFVRCDRNTVERVDAMPDAYVPTTVIAREPAGGGQSYEAVNLLSRYRKNAFQTDGTSVDFYLETSPLDSDGDVLCWVAGEQVYDYTVDRTHGIVSFTTPPPAPAAGSADNLVIQFPKTVEGYADTINKCSIITTYAGGGGDRMVLSGNPDKPNVDWISGLGDPTYFPDLGYATVGGDASAILGYCRIGSTLAIIKEDNGQDSTVFFRSAEITSDGAVRFPITPGMTGVGAAGAGSFATLLDEPLFLSGTGVYAVTTNYLTGERVGQNRSFYLNAQLTAEDDLRDAEAVSYKGLYLLAFPNGHVYVLDGRQNKSYRSESLGDFVYEGYYWENIPARCWLDFHLPVSEDGEREVLYFGDENGNICRFNTDIESVRRFNDNGDAIDAVWATKMDDDGDATILKTMIRRGCAVTMKPYTRSGAQICFRTDRDAVDKPVRQQNLDIFDWADINFERFTFDSNDGAREIFFGTKAKKYKRLQIVIRNQAVNEGFGVFGISKHYVEGNWASNK